MVILFALYSSWSFADVRTIEVCKSESNLVREVNSSRTEITIDTVDRDPSTEHRQALTALLRDRRAVIAVSDGASVDAVLAGIDDDGAILSSGFRGTSPDCLSVRTGHEIWSKLSAADALAD